MEHEAVGKEATLPLKVDTVIKTKWLDGAYHLARVVSTRPRPGGKDDTDKEYYMHFINMNRRMDTWLTADAMDLSWHEMDSIDERRCAVASLTYCSNGKPVANSLKGGTGQECFSGLFSSFSRLT